MAQVIGRHAGAGQPGLDAAGAPAVARRQGQVVGRGQGQRVVAPFAGDGVGAHQQRAIDHDAAAHPGAEDGREHRARTGARPIGGLGHGQAVGVVGEPQRASEQGLEVVLQRLAVQAG